VIVAGTGKAPDETGVARFVSRGLKICHGPGGKLRHSTSKNKMQESSMTLPTFKYHPDPLATRNIVKSDTECVCCEKSRGFVYTGPVYAVEQYDECICPWCIADGSAHKKLKASFTDEAGIGGGGMWDQVPDAVIEEVAYRTPGFSGWQQEQWWTHCNDAALFLGRAGRDELMAFGAQAIAAIQDSAGLPDGPEWDQFFDALDKDGPPTAYMFRCAKCGQLGGYQDCD
jgi:uncharacterized protein CbrC (UPF0167 family)